MHQLIGLIRDMMAAFINIQIWAKFENMCRVSFDCIRIAEPLRFALRLSCKYGYSENCLISRIFDFY